MIRPRDAYPVIDPDVAYGSFSRARGIDQHIQEAKRTKKSQAAREGNEEEGPYLYPWSDQAARKIAIPECNHVTFHSLPLVGR